jgi:LmbE family N-acetylglucosaminyl deacetylase
VRCSLFTATDGDAGKTSGLKIQSRQELGVVRRRELRAASRVLGIADVETPGHPDGALGTVDQDALIAQIVAHLRRAQSQVVITFGPEGAPNAHRDHKVISRAATAGFFLAGNPGSRLFYVSWPTPAPDAELRTRAVPATARIDVRAFNDVERAAWREHASQHALQQRFDALALTEEELFAFAAGVPQPRAMVDDLFEGLDRPAGPG